MPLGAECDGLPPHPQASKGGAGSGKAKLAPFERGEAHSLCSLLQRPPVSHALTESPIVMANRSVGKKRKAVEDLEAEKTLFGAFQQAAASVTSLYTLAAQQQKRSQEAGAKQALVRAGSCGCSCHYCL